MNKELMNQKTNPLLFALAVFIMFTGVDCKKDIVDPPPDDIKPGRRDYVWTVDTLPVPAGDLFTPTRIWGSSPTDVWIIGFGSPSWNLLWHYDGISWKKDSLQRQISPSALWGSANNNIWLGNYSHNSFWRYDGIQWYKFSEHVSPTGFDRVSISGIWGTSANNIWAVGFADQFNGGTQYKGILMHFNGSQWQFLQMPDTRIGLVDIRQQNSNGMFFLQGTEYDESLGAISKLFTFDGVNLKEIFSSTQYNATVNEIKGRVYFVYNQKIFHFQNNSLTVWKDLTNTTFLGKIWGRSEKDFFSFATDGIGHFNGTDFVTVFPVSIDLRVSSGYVSEDEVFFPCFSVTQNLSIVLHGKLSITEEKPSK